MKSLYTLYINLNFFLEMYDKNCTLQIYVFHDSVQIVLYFFYCDRDKLSQKQKSNLSGFYYFCVPGRPAVHVIMSWSDFFRFFCLILFVVIPMAGWDAKNRKSMEIRDNEVKKKINT